MDLGLDELISLIKGGPSVWAAHALAYVSLPEVACIENIVHVGETWIILSVDCASGV